MQRKTFYVEMHGYFVVHEYLQGNSATEEATPSSVFVENGYATWFSVADGNTVYK